MCVFFNKGGSVVMGRSRRTWKINQITPTSILLRNHGSRMGGGVWPPRVGMPSGHGHDT